MEGRAGRYIAQPPGFRAFIPAPIASDSARTSARKPVLSSQIEGTQSSLQDLLSAEAEVGSADRPPEVDEVVNYVRAMNRGLARLKDLPVSVRLIREIHAELLQGVRGSRLTPGELRRSQNWIGPGGASLADATFVPPPPEDVPKALGDLEVMTRLERRQQHRAAFSAQPRRPRGCRQRCGT